MNGLFTYRNAQQTHNSSSFVKVFFLLLVLFSQAVTLSAHTVDYFSSCGYVCAGSTVTVNAHLSATAGNTNYNWQFRDNSGIWKCFVNGSNAINGVNFTVSNATAKGQLSAAPTLTIANATTALSNVDVRIVMADGTNVSPCPANPSYPVYGTDKSLKLHVLTGSDCSNIATYCAGGTPPLKLGDLIWNDINGDGNKDTDEPGVPNATVKLYADNNNDNIADGAAVATTTTNASGLYYFGNLKPANYIVGVTIPAGYTKGPASTIDPDNNVNNDNNGVNLVGANQAGSEVRSKAITLSASGEPTTDGDDQYSNLTLDIALCGNSQLGDFVWNDKNANGIQDLNEPGIQGVTVKLLFPDGVTTGTTTTDANGKYLFTALAPGTYKLTFSTPAGLIASPVNQGTSDAKDSDPVSGSVTAAVAAGTSNLTIDAGFYVKPISNLTLGNQVWNDFDGDGKRDDNEPGIPGATISLYTDNNGDNLPDGAAIKTTTSDANGLYQFTNLTEGKYIVSMPILPGYQKSPNTTTQDTSPYPDNNRDDDNNLIRLVGANGPGGILYTNFITLTANQEPTDDGDGANGNNTLDLAECGNSFIGDFVWKDLNGNGIQDASEPGINGVLVTITFSDGTTSTTTTTTYNAANNANSPQFDGYYNFPNLGPGTYKITFSTPAGLTPSPSNQGGNDAKDSDPVNGAPVTVILVANQSNFTIDAGFYHKLATNLTLGNQVWNDFDGDGKRDSNEPGIPGATISLYTDNDGDNFPDGAAIKTTTTDALGRYQFTNLTEGRYIASLPILPGYQQSPNTTTQDTSPFPDNNVDDDNNLVRLVGPNGPGGIVFTNAITLTANQEPTDDGDDANGNNTFDLAECGNSFIGDFVWNDYNGNGIQDAGEPGINGVSVTITFSDGTTSTTKTATYNAANNANTPQFDGYYNFPNLGPGTYKITFATPAGLHASPANAGDDTKDSDPVNGAPVTVTLVANQSDFTIDAGFTAFVTPPTPTCPNLSVGNMVFIDLNGNGTKEIYEPGIGGLTVKLYADNDGNNVADGAAISTLMTAEDGTYYFGNLAAGKYIVGVTTGSNYTQGANGNANPNDNKDNDNNGVRLVNDEVFSNFITLSAGDEPINDGSDNNSNLTLDFGLKLGSTTPACTNHCDCKNDCTHTGCGHANCGHNSCKNDCTHTNCGHENCGHNSCKNDCKHTNCGHKNCGKSSSNSRVATADAESVVAAITNPEITNTSVSVFPNPASDYIVIKVMAAKSGKGLARITDLSGKLVATKTAVINNGMNLIKFDQLGGLNAGTYFVQLDFNYHIYNQQLVVGK